MRSPEGLVLLSPLSSETLSVPSLITDYEKTQSSDTELEQILSSDKLSYWEGETISAFNWSTISDLYRQHAYSYRIESDRSKKSAFGDWALEQSARMDELRGVADRFIHQLHSLYAGGEAALPQIARRVEEATRYFLPRWRQLFSSLMETQHQVRGMKKVKEFIAELDLLYGQTVRQVRALLRIEGSMQSLSTGLYPDRQTIQIEERLEAWIKEAKAEVKIPYVVPGEEGPTSKKTAKEKKTKEPRISTQEKTLELLRSGLTPLEVASERSLSIGTIYAHIAQLLEQGLLSDEEALISPEKLKELSPYFAEMDEAAGLKPIYEATSGRYDYHELRLYLSAYRHRRRK